MRSNWVEWTALGISVAAILGVAGFLVIDAVTSSADPPMPVVTLHAEDAYTTSAGWVLPATLGNDGDEPAERIVVEASGEVGGEVERSEVEVDYLPAGTTVEVFFGFSGQPAATPSVRVVGFRAP